MIGIGFANVTDTTYCTQFFGIDYTNDTNGGSIDGLWQPILLCVIYTCFLAMILRQFHKVIKSSLPGVSLQKIFHSLLTASTVIRLVLFSLPRANTRSHLSVFVQFFITSLPGQLDFSVYMLLLLYWVAVYYQAVRLQQTADNHQRILAYVFVAMNVLSIVTLIALGAWLVYSGVGFKRMLFASGLYICILIGIACVLFLSYGIWVYERLRHYPIVAGRDRMRHVTIVASMCMSCFALRAPMCLLLFVNMCKDMDVSLTTYQIIVLSYLVVGELLPNALVLYTVRSPSITLMDANYPRADGTAGGIVSHTTTTTTTSGYGAISERIVAEPDPLYLPFFRHLRASGTAAAGAAALPSPSFTSAYPYSPFSMPISPTQQHHQQQRLMNAKATPAFIL